MRLALLIALLATGCHSWHTQPLAPEVLVASHPTNVRVTRRDGSRIVIDRPSVRADTIVGTLHASSRHAPVAVPLGDVQDVATLRPNALKTTLLVATLTALVAFAAVIAGGTICCPPD